ncbi:hypothetical protein E4M02_10975 [Brevundimonas sp. S30B]|uniref:hypothetical protein n=1 Tax=unclassified Brevundimonas TaxID=2622653 RepID=UPI001072A439|nr:MULTISPECIES: hypothetical protein [unclassified Brevundimonas]QBX38636.1 hypothetical protein E4M01_13235 [Brevundimonas sp. MF30-B]TFW01227.1 hypothetical protein E4M02_10975 [Brevundimonas sp. S30B]
MTPQAPATPDRGPMRPLIFHREGFYYPLDLPLYDDLSAHAECNPGTLKITCALTGEILWRPQ